MKLKMPGLRKNNSEVKQPLTLKQKKKRKKKIVVASGVAAAAVVAIVGVNVASNLTKASADDGVSVSSAEVETGDVATTIDSSGSISNTGTISVDIPESIEIDELLVAQGDTVKKGDKLASVVTSSAAEALADIIDKIDALEDEIDELEDDDDADDTDSDVYLQLVSYNSQLDELTTLKKQVKKIFNSGYIVATSDGVVDSINSDSSSTSTSTSSAYATVASADTSDDTATIITLETDTAASSYETSQDSAKETALTSSATTTITDDYINENISITAPETGKSPQTSLGDTDAYTGKISWNLTSSTFAAGKSYTATIVLTSNDGYAFSDADDYAITVSGATVTSVSVKGTSNTSGNKLYITAQFEETDEAASNQSSANEANSSSNESESTAASNTQSTASSSASKTSSASGSSSAASSSTSNSSDDSTSSEYSVSTTEMFTIASDDEVTIAVSVDELDINSVEIGQNAVVTLDAFEDEEFEGTVTDKSSSSSESGEYEVEVTIAREDGMLEGMSASVTVNIEEVNDVLIVPVSALIEDGDSYYVYTQCDDEGNLSGETDVEVGLSNGTYAEITSGLAEGDTVYYTKADSTDDDSSSMGMGGMMQGGGGQMPSGGGDMPQGGGGNGGQGGPGGN